MSSRRVSCRRQFVFDGQPSFRRQACAGYRSEAWRTLTLPKDREYDKNEVRQWPSKSRYRESSFATLCVSLGCFALLAALEGDGVEEVWCWSVSVSQNDDIFEIDFPVQQGFDMGSK